MHGQKKRRKRILGGEIVVEAHRLTWSLLSEPQKSTEHGYMGMRISVRSCDGEHRELIMEYPFPGKRTGNGSLQIPQRPKFSEKNVASEVQGAVASGWDPLSRGKAVIYQVS